MLTAPLVIEYPFKRTTGPVVGAFLTGLREGILVGIKGATGGCSSRRPSTTRSPARTSPRWSRSGRPATVTTWAWVRSPMPKHPLDRPFAWALIQPDGADTAMLGAVDAGSPDAMRTGMRVEPVWADEREGHITDLAPLEAGRMA